MKRFLFFSLLLTLSMLLLVSCGGVSDAGTTVPQTSATTTAAITTTTPITTTASEFLYKKNDDGGIRIQGYLGNQSTIVIPAEIEGLPVVEIGNAAFTSSWCKASVVSVILPNTLKTIDDNAFEGSAISEINLPNTLTHIGSRAFADCKGLTYITISSDCLDDASHEAFCDSGLENVVLAEGVTEIPASAFVNTKLREITIPQTVTSINFQAFAGCESLQTVVLNEGLQSIADMAFYGTALQELSIPASVNRLSKYAFMKSNLLHSLRFLGDAPDGFLDKESFYSVIYPDYVPTFVIYFYEGAEGFTAPEWNGIPSMKVFH